MSMYTQTPGYRVIKHPVLGLSGKVMNVNLRQGFTKYQLMKSSTFLSGFMEENAVSLLVWKFE